MIPEIDEALSSLLRTKALGKAEVEVVFDAPTTEWAARRNAPTVNLYLYDLREDSRWRQWGLGNDVVDGRVSARRPAERLFKLSYLVTAWTQRPEDEHRLLDSLLATLVWHESIPRSDLTGALASAKNDVRLSVGMPPPEDRGFADVWSALGGQLKPSIDVVVTAPFVPSEIAIAPLASGGAGVEMSDTDSGAADPRRTRHEPPERAEPAEPPEPAKSGGSRRRATT
ncbi:DUF4255 domain-containing protein [Pseudactinotalea sp. HY160]|uniref:DUF4255 domain-containing protein n=1 Tax=Pseudactinotalea sp. HY160 TaxID=2654490 RepID=UPI0013117323|nr:DUF4255 domain-containing protein [Pseudactinotalea sp. HY160]